MRDAVERDTVGCIRSLRLQIEHLADLRFQFADALLPGAGNGLIGGDHHAADARDVVQGFRATTIWMVEQFGELAILPLCPSSASLGFTSGTTSGQRSSCATR